MSWQEEEREVRGSGRGTGPAAGLATVPRRAAAAVGWGETTALICPGPGRSLRAPILNPHHPPPPYHLKKLESAVSSELRRDGSFPANGTVRHDGLGGGSQQGATEGKEGGLRWKGRIGGGQSLGSGKDTAPLLLPSSPDTKRTAGGGLMRSSRMIDRGCERSPRTVSGTFQGPFLENVLV